MLNLKVDFWINLVSQVLTMATKGYYRPFWQQANWFVKLIQPFFLLKGSERRVSGPETAISCFFDWKLVSVLTIRECFFHESPHLVFALKSKARAMQ